MFVLSSAKLVLFLLLLGGSSGQGIIGENTTTDPPPTPGGGGDPHFATWGGERFTFNGECDLVLLRNPTFADGAGLYVHVRTKIHDGGRHEGGWSDMEGVAVQIGPDIFEARGAYEYRINGKPSATLPTLIGGFQISLQQLNANRDRLVYVIHLGGDKEIRIRAFGEIMWVHFKGEETTMFKGSEGLLGHYDERGQKMARDGTTVMNNSNEFGMEWQVHPKVDPVLFHSVEGPQHPQQCKMPVRKNLRSNGDNDVVEEEATRLAVAANKACAHVRKGDRGDCIYDVVATKNLEVAQAYAY